MLSAPSPSLAAKLVGHILSIITSTILLKHVIVTAFLFGLLLGEPLILPGYLVPLPYFVMPFLLGEFEDAVVEVFLPFSGVPSLLAYFVR